MKGKAMKKVAGGKLIRIEIDYDDKISKIIISGDFFIYPEESIALIEKSLERLSVKETSYYFRNVIANTVFRNKIEIIGFTIDDLAETVKEALI